MMAQHRVIVLLQAAKPVMLTRMFLSRRFHHNKLMYLHNHTQWAWTLKHHHPQAQSIAALLSTVPKRFPVDKIDLQ
jgi:hypothetical protein